MIDPCFPNMTRMERNALGRAMGFGGCSACGDTWDWKEKHVTHAPNAGAAFPLCEECFQAKTPEERLPFYDQLLDSWCAMSVESIPWVNKMRPILRAEVLAGK